jgi:hypothetical protein
LPNITRLGQSIFHGVNQTNPEVTNISAHGFWLFDDLSEQEYFLSFQNFPWFAKASIEQITSVTREGRSIFHWPNLDVDLDLERIEHPERYPLLAKSA